MPVQDMQPGDVKVTSLDVGPSYTTSAGSTALVTWANIASPNPQNWVGLFRAGASDADSLAERFLDGNPAGSTNLVIPVGTPPGEYELRLFADKSLIRLASSPSLYVQGAGVTGAGGITIKAANSYAAGGQIIFDWHTTAPSAAPGDTVSVVRIEDGAVLGSMNVLGSDGRGTITLPGTVTPGHYYELRYTRGATAEIWGRSPSWLLGAVSIGGWLKCAFGKLQPNGSRQDCEYNISAYRNGSNVSMRHRDTGQIIETWWIPQNTVHGWAYFTIDSRYTVGQYYQPCVYDGGTGNAAIPGPAWLCWDGVS